MRSIAVFEAEAQQDLFEDNLPRRVESWSPVLNAFTASAVDEWKLLGQRAPSRKCTAHF